MPTQVARDSGRTVDTTVQPFQIRGRFLTAVSLRVTGAVDAAFWEALDLRLQLTPQFLTDAPMILDLGQIQEMTEPAHLIDLVAGLTRRRLSVFGCQNAAEGQARAIKAAGLIAVNGGKDAPMRGVGKSGPAETPPELMDAPAAEPGPAANAAVAPQAAPVAAPKPEPLILSAISEPPQASNLVIDRPVRSGEMVFADSGDLTVIGPVSSGAELVAVGNIHVYGSLRGRAMAGANGDRAARIFCRSLDAELLAVAGLYRTSEGIESEYRKSPAHIHLDGERLLIRPIA